MDTRQFKLNLAGLFSQRGAADSSGKDENQPPPTDRRSASRLFTPVPPRAQLAARPARPQSAQSCKPPARLLQLDSRVDDTPSFEEEHALQVIDNQELYGRDCRMERKISNLEDFSAERKPIDEFKKLSSAIQREIKQLQEDKGEDRLMTARNLYQPEANERLYTLKTTPRKDSWRQEATFSTPVTKETQLLEKIGMLEREVRDKDEEIATLQKQVQARTASIRSLEKELSVRGGESESRGVVGQLCEVLGVKSAQSVVQVVRKLETAAKSAARLERLMAEISTIVCPDKLETSSEAVVLAVRRWESELLSLRSHKSDDSDFAQHFRQVFDIKESENLRDAANRVFMQIHELRTFSKHLKQLLSLSEDCSLSSVLLFIRQLLRRVPT